MKKLIPLLLLGLGGCHLHFHIGGKYDKGFRQDAGMVDLGEDSSTDEPSTTEVQNSNGDNSNRASVGLPERANQR